VLQEEVGFDVNGTSTVLTICFLRAALVIAIKKEAGTKRRNEENRNKISGERYAAFMSEGFR
jgi:hypothetical protein